MNIYTERFVDLCLYQSGIEQCSAGHSVGPGAYDHYMFCFVLAGSGILFVDDTDCSTRSFSTTAGEGFLLRPGQVSMYIADMEDPWKYVWLEFDGLCVPEMIQSTSLSRENPIYTSDNSELKDKVSGEMLNIVEHPEASSLFVTAHLYAFAGYLIDSAPSKRRRRGPSIRDRYIRTALEYIARNYSKKIRIEEIAVECGIDRSCFGKLFHQALGQSPQRFLLEYRMMRARTLLQDTAMTVAEIGSAVGYDNALHFSRAFKDLYGMSPREWRIRNRRSVHS